MSVAIVDYGMGNLGSVRRALAELGVDATIVEHPDRLAAASGVIVPGVGSFTDGMTRLDAGGWSDALRRHCGEQGKPLLGICLGMQLLADFGNEGIGDADATPGLGLLPGDVQRLDRLGCRLRIPHVGWNSIAPRNGAGLFADIPEGTDFYFVHSYAFHCTDDDAVLATVDYGVPVVAAVGRGRVFGVQFHPEKSSRAGFRVLRNFLELASC